MSLLWRHGPDWVTQILLEDRDATEMWREIEKADIPYSSKHPVLFFKGHHLVTLITESANERIMHGGAKETLTEL